MSVLPTYFISKLSLNSQLSLLSTYHCHKKEDGAFKGLQMIHTVLRTTRGTDRGTT